MLNFAVVPLVGTWIEIPEMQAILMHDESFPSWERGLKFLYRQYYAYDKVVPLVGTWIEIGYLDYLDGNYESFPSWERGLKSYFFCL